MIPDCSRRRPRRCRPTRCTTSARRPALRARLPPAGSSENTFSRPVSNVCSISARLPRSRSIHCSAPLDRAAVARVLRVEAASSAKLPSSPPSALRVLVPLRRIAVIAPALEQRIALELFLDERDEIEIGQLQQLDRLHQLRRHHQRLRLPKLEALCQRHGARTDPVNLVQFLLSTFGALVQA